MHGIEMVRTLTPSYWAGQLVTELGKDVLQAYIENSGMSPEEKLKFAEKGAKVIRYARVAARIATIIVMMDAVSVVSIGDAAISGIDFFSS